MALELYPRGGASGEGAGPRRTQRDFAPPPGATRRSGHALPSRLRSDWPVRMLGGRVGGDVSAAECGGREAGRGRGFVWKWAWLWAGTEGRRIGGPGGGEGAGRADRG